MHNAAIRLGLLAATVMMVPVFQVPGRSEQVTHLQGLHLSQFQPDREQTLQDAALRLYQQGRDQVLAGNYQAALTSFDQSRGIFQDIRETYGPSRTLLQGVGDLLNDMGFVYGLLSEYAQALDLFQQALDIRQEIEDQGGQAESLNNLGFIYSILGEYSQALNVHKRALALRQQLDDLRAVGESLNNIGGIYERQGAYAQALDLFQQALDIRKTLGDPVAVGESLNNIGGIYDILGYYTQALDFYQQSLAIVRESRDPGREAVVLNNIGFIYTILGDFAQALDLHQQALHIRREINDWRGVGESLNNIGFVYDYSGEYPQALDFYQQALAIRQELGDRPGESITLNNLGGVYDRLDDHAQALNRYQQSLLISQELGDRPGEAVSLSNIGWVLKHQGQAELAILFFKQSVNIYEAIRGDLSTLNPQLRMTYTDTIAGTYRTLADLLLQADRILEAQRVLDLLKVQELDEYLHDVRGTEQTITGIDLLQAEQQLEDRQQTISNRAIAVGQELAQLRKIHHSERTPAQMQRINELEAIQAEVVAQFEMFINSANIQDLIAQLSREERQQDLVNRLDDLITLQDNLAALEQNAVLLYPLILDDRLELVLVTPFNPPTRYSVPVRRAELNATIVEFRQALEDRNSDPRPVAQQLYQWLFADLAHDLEAIGTQTILYAPDGVLRYVPLAALHDGEQWLVESDYRINHITAASLTNLSLEPAQQPEILAAAFSQGQFDIEVGERTFVLGGLPFAGREVENLAAAYPGTTKLLDDDFSADAILPIMDDHTIVHLATHAAFVQGSPGNSFILFGNGDRITLEEIKQWRGRFRQIDLIVLSACETGVGESLGRGEEILGFGYLMQQAGARAAIASLWRVSDGGTQVLMDAFYANLSGGMSKVEALQQAQLALIEGDFTASDVERGASIEVVSTRTGLPVNVANTLTHPYYWAPFILIGNGL
jgi:CHAT domain-containing protein/tetratricopeptide (TPR) repeat protein